MRGAASFGTRVVIVDEPAAALGVKASGMVLDLIRRIRDWGIPVVLIRHDTPHVFEIADRIHVYRLGQRVGGVSPKERTMTEVVSLMTGALRLEENGELVDATGHVTELPDEDAHA